MLYNVFPGGNIKKGFRQSTLASGLSPFQRIGYAADVPRNHFSIQRVFDGTSEAWHEMQARETENGQGLAVGDELRMVLVDPTSVFEGAVLQLKKDLPSDIGLTVEVVSNAADPTKDSFVSVMQAIPAGTKAGDVYLPPHYSAEDFSTGGLSLIVTITGEDGVAAGTLVNMGGVCFAVRLDVRNMHVDYHCVCANTPCPTTYPAPACADSSAPMDVSGFVSGATS